MKQTKTKRKKKKRTTSMQRFINSTTKVVIWWVLIFGTIWVTWSYVLATMGKEQIAETLASEVLRVLFGSIIVYVVTAAISNIFKNNNGGIFGETITPPDDSDQQ